MGVCPDRFHSLGARWAAQVITVDAWSDESATAKVETRAARCSAGMWSCGAQSHFETQRSSESAKWLTSRASIPWDRPHDEKCRRGVARPARYSHGVGPTGDSAGFTSAIE